MELTQFAAMISANILANGLTLLYIFAIARGAKSEKENGDLRELPNWLLFFGMVGPIACAFGIYFTVH